MYHPTHRRTVWLIATVALMFVSSSCNRTNQSSDKRADKQGDSIPAKPGEVNPGASDQPVKPEPKSDEFYRRGPFQVRSEDIGADEPSLKKLAGPAAKATTDSVPVFLVDPQPGDVVADIGCGYGNQSVRLSRMYDGDIAIVGRDISEKSIEKARNAKNKYDRKNIAFNVSLAEDVLIDPNSIDVAFMSKVIGYVLRQVETKDAFAQSVFLSLRPGGSLVIIEYKCTTDIRLATDELLLKAGFEPGRRIALQEESGVVWYTMLEYRRPLP